MKELTIDKAIENKFNPIDCVKYYFPEYTDKMCDYILWEETCFPMSMKTTLKQLHNKFLSV